MTFVSLIAPVRADGLQLFGSKKSSEKDRGNKSEELRNNDEMTEDYSSTEVSISPLCIVMIDNVATYRMS